MITPDINPDFSVSTTSTRWDFLTEGAKSCIVSAVQKSAAWGTAVLAIKYAHEPYGQPYEFSPAVRIGPPASGTGVTSPRLETRAIPVIVVEVATAESGEALRLICSKERE